MENEKKMAAAISAVMAYIKTEEEALCMRSAAAPAAEPPAPTPTINLWGASGRQAMMQMRNLMQMKTFHGGKIH